MAQILGLERLRARLTSGLLGARGGAVVVGYTQSYAIFVHENLKAHHPNGQAKFLEQPARELSKALAGQIKAAVAKGQTLVQALLVAGLRLQRESQKLCPVLTGALRASAFTRLE